MKALICALIGLTLAAPCIAKDDFKDVPKDHWAAESVKILAQNGVMKGYKDNSYRGDKPITRYELAVTLERVIYFIEQSQKPVAMDNKPASKQSQAGSNISPIDFLVKGGYVPLDSALLKKPDDTVTKEQLAQVLATVAAKLIENKVPVQDTATSETVNNPKR